MKIFHLTQEIPKSDIWLYPTFCILLNQNQKNFCHFKLPQNTEYIFFNTIVLWNKSLEWVLIAFVRKKLFSILQHHQKTRKKHIFIWSIIKNFFYWKIVLHTMKRPDEWNFSFISSSKVNYKLFLCSKNGNEWLQREICFFVSA